MKPVEQQVIDPDIGDCFSACIASILELPLESVPTYQSDEAWDRWLEWFRNANLALVQLANHGPVPGYAIRSIHSTYPDRLHAVVTFNGVVVWDPSLARRDPSDDWYQTWAHHWIIVPIDLMKPIDRDRLLVDPDA